jgi:hypothetical protein
MQNKILKKYNAIIEKVDHSKPVIDTLSNFTDDDWKWFIAGKTLAFGRSAQKSIDNANYSIKHNSKAELIKLWGFESEL